MESETIEIYKDGETRTVGVIQWKQLKGKRGHFDGWVEKDSMTETAETFVPELFLKKEKPVTKEDEVRSAMAEIHQAVNTQTPNLKITKPKQDVKRKNVSSKE